MTDVYIAPGHGLRPNGTMDPGAMDGNKSEQSEGNLVAKAAEGQLKRMKVSVYRQPQGGPNFTGTITDIRNRGPKVAVELHHDWNQAPRGGFGFYNTPEQRKLCEAIEKVYRDNNLPTRRHLTNLPGRSSPPSIVGSSYPKGTVTVLWEIDRIGSVFDHALYGRVIAHGIMSYLGIPNISPPTQTWQQVVINNMDTVNLSKVTSDSRTWVRGEDVGSAQGLLVARSHAPANTIRPNGTLDKIGGPGTKAAVISFQRSRGIVQDAIVGPITWGHLLSGR